MTSEPDWRDCRAVDPAVLPRGIGPWLLDRASLTDRLLELTGGDFQVRRLRQRAAAPFASECRFLGLPEKKARAPAAQERAQGRGQGEPATALIREVALLCFGEPWVFARSVIPESSMAGPLADLRELGDESLGARLFREPNLRLGARELCELPGGSDYLHKDCRQRAPAWGRRSHFSIEGRPLLVSEVFLERFNPAAGRPRAGT